MKKKLLIGCIILIGLLVIFSIVSICDLINSIDYHYGTYGGAVVFEDYSVEALQVVSEKFVAGYYFYSPNAYIMDVWYMGRTYSLSEAYYKGLLCEDDIEDIYNQYISRYPERAKKKPRAAYRRNERES